jgi:hypothetical protein
VKEQGPTEGVYPILAEGNAGFLMQRADPKNSGQVNLEKRIGSPCLLSVPPRLKGFLPLRFTGFAILKTLDPLRL